MAAAPPALFPTAPLADPDVPERERLVELLNTYRGNIAAVRRNARLPAQNVYRWVEQYGLSLSEYRG